MSVIERSIQVGWQLRVFFTEDVFAPANPVLKNTLADTAMRKVLVVLDQSVAAAQPELSQRIESYFFSHMAQLRQNGRSYASASTRSCRNGGVCPRRRKPRTSRRSPMCWSAGTRSANSCR
ncbi:MAG: hypothetical protein ABSF34_09650 [Verrucomicrobiota bacterium]